MCVLSQRLDAKVAQSPALAGRVIAELLYRKCSFAASLAVATTVDMDRLGLTRLDQSISPEDPEEAQQRKRLFRQIHFAERIGQ